MLWGSRQAQRNGFREGFKFFYLVQNNGYLAWLLILAQGGFSRSSYKEELLGGFTNRRSDHMQVSNIWNHARILEPLSGNYLKYKV